MRGEAGCVVSLGTGASGTAEPHATTMPAALARRLLNDFQRDFPLVERPFAALAATIGGTEEDVLATLHRFASDGTVSRVGAVFRPGSVGASTLAAIAVPDARLSAVAGIVSAYPEVNHNYEREHRLNLWFVVTAADGRRLAQILAAIELETGLSVVSMPLVADYYIDLGFALDGPRRKSPAARRRSDGPSPLALDASDRVLLAALQEGLPLVARPFEALARRAGRREHGGEQDVLEKIIEWTDRGAIKRFGVIVRHRALGYVANAMCAWDVPAGETDRLGRRLARETAVTLCYRRARAGSAWPYNLFCMIHGRRRGDVEAEIAALSLRHGLAAYPHAVLFSRRAFKQRGARYVEHVEAVHG
jgi:DNA-binding Lrp family transcriptional regulator